MSTATGVARREEALAPQTQNPASVMDVFKSESFKQQVAAALPRHIRIDSMMRIVLTEVRMNPDLQKCTPASFMGALLKAAQTGLRPGMNGEAFLVPRWNGKIGAMEAQYQPGYRGLGQLAYRSGEVTDLDAQAVYAADHFAYSLGSNPKIEHTPDMTTAKRDEDIIAFYAVINLKSGGRIMKVMSRSDVDAVRDRFGPKTKAGKLVGPWVSDYAAMGMKTVLLRALKFAPMENERLSAAVAAEDALFNDRVAASVVGTTARGNTASRVAERLGVDMETGEVEDAEWQPDPDLAPATETALSDDLGPQGDTEPQEAAYSPESADSEPPVSQGQLRQLGIVWRKLADIGYSEEELRDLLQQHTGLRSRKVLSFEQAHVAIARFTAELEKHEGEAA